MAKVFSKEAVAHFGNKYHTDVRPQRGRASGGGCMKAVYTGLGALYGDKYKFQGSFHKSFFAAARRLEVKRHLPEGRLNTIDRVFAALEREGVTGERAVYAPRKTGWQLPDGTRVTSLESQLLSQIAGLPNGSYFFGAAVNDAVHSLLLRLEKTDSGVRVFWMDQFSDGYSAVRSHSFVKTPDVTGHLDAEIRQFGAGPASVWRLLPDKAAGTVVPVDTDGDGLIDHHAPAVVEVARNDAESPEDYEEDHELAIYASNIEHREEPEEYDESEEADEPEDDEPEQSDESEEAEPEDDESEEAESEDDEPEQYDESEEAELEDDDESEESEESEEAELEDDDESEESEESEEAEPQDDESEESNEPEEYDEWLVAQSNAGDEPSDYEEDSETDEEGAEDDDGERG